MKKISLIFLLALLVGCSSKKVQSNSINENQEQIYKTDAGEPEDLLNIEDLNDNEQKILLEREKFLKLIKEREDKVLNNEKLFERKIPRNTEDMENEREVDISQCRKVTERFF